MNEAVIVGFLGILGLCMGSFANATVWRLHNKKNIAKDRSECEQCHHKLAWFDLIPLVSWLSLGGKCRYCRAPIRKEIIFTEVVTGLLFVASYWWWPQNITAFYPELTFGLWLVALTMLIILFLYDMKWLLLPDKVMFPLIATGVLMMFVRISEQGSWLPIFESLYAVTILSGLYLVLFLVSKGKWVGFGDVKLGLFLGLGLGTWPLALLCLFLANCIGCLFVIPGMLVGKLRRSSRVPFGPFLILGFTIAMLFGNRMIEWYMSSSGL